MKKLFSTLILATLAGCQGIPLDEQGRQAESLSDKAPAMPFAEPEKPTRELNSELVFDYLVGEIGARMGRFDAATEAYLAAAENAEDAYAAERATRLALHQKDLETARQAAAQWARLAPNNLEARRFLGVLLLRKGETGLALEQFDAMRRIADAEGKDGLLQVAAVLAGEPDYKAARQMFARLAAEDAHSPGALYASAVLNTAQHRYAEAKSDLREALSQKPAWALARVLLSRVLVADKHSSEALTVLSEGVELAPRNQLLRTSYARLLVAMGQYEQALEQFRELHRQSPDDQETLYGYAMLATQQEQWGVARGLWQKLRGEPKYYAEATYFLAQIEESEDNKQLALGLYRSVNKGPLVVDASIRAANLMRETGDTDAARSLLQRVRKKNPKRSTDLYLAEAQLLQASKAPKETILGVYEEALRATPDNVDLLYNRGLYYSELGRYAAMEADFRAVLRKDPQNANALNALGYMLAEQNIRLQEARGYVEQALKMDPDSSAILDSMGWVLYRLGELEAARGYLQKAYAKDPDDEIAAHLIEVLWAEGDKRGARALFRSARKDAPESPHLMILEGQLFTGSR